MVTFSLNLSHHPRQTPAASARRGVRVPSPIGAASSTSFISFSFRTLSRNGRIATPLSSDASALFSRLLSTTPAATSFCSSSYKLFAVTTGVAFYGTPFKGSI
jgi:hypothetical protein